MSATKTEITTYTKCACANCGHVIEFGSWEAGKVISCPQCKEQSMLPEPEKLSVMHPQGPGTPEFKNCPSCGTQMQFWALRCPTCEQSRQFRKMAIFAMAGVGVLGLLCLAGVVAVHRYRAAEEKAKIAAMTVPSGSRILFEAPKPRLPKSTNDLQPLRFYLEQRRGSDLVMAVGDIENVSENLHRDMRADVDVLDKTGAKVGTVNDFMTELGPHQTWHFVATVTATNALSLRFAGVKENL